MRQFLSIKIDETEGVLAENICHREKEFVEYQMNIDNYTAMLDDLPQGEWPEGIAQYKNRPLEQVPEEHDVAVRDLNYRDRLRLLLRTEKAEQAKSEAVLDVLIDRIPQGRRQAAIDAALLRIAQRDPKP